ncbi:MAG: glycosyltransferase family 61 protein, partial [Pseudomonadota bacterium]
MTSDGGGGDAGADGRVYPDARLFDRVEVAPLARLLDEDVGDMHVGGPCWPEGEAAAALRYLDHEGRPLDRPTPRGRGGAAEVETVPGTWWWIGPLTRHFGHFLSEFAIRIRPVLDHDPQARLVFARSFGGPFPAPRAAPSFVEAVLDWHGAALDRVRFVDRPTRFERLGSCPQPERLYPGPESAPRTPYLDALSARLRARLGPRRAEGTIYVSRARAQRLYAGEIEVEAAMAAAGVRVVHPETLPLAEQLATIRNAET